MESTIQQALMELTVGLLDTSLKLSGSARLDKPLCPAAEAYLTRAERAHTTACEIVVQNSAACGGNALEGCRADITAYIGLSQFLLEQCLQCLAPGHGCEHCSNKQKRGALRSVPGHSES